jgi:hypothetical protein
MAEKIINGNLLLYGALGLGLGLIVMNNRYEEEKHYWRRIHAYRKHAVLNGLQAIHAGLYDLSHHNKIEGEEMIERGAEIIQRAEFHRFPHHGLYPHHGRHHMRHVGHIHHPHHSGHHTSHPIKHIVHSHHMPIQHHQVAAQFNNSKHRYAIS